MTQTTGATTASVAKLEISSDGSTWTDVSGEAMSIEGMEQTRTSSEAYTFDGDTAIILEGKREPMEITLNVTYTEGASGVFEVVRGLFETYGSRCYIRWSPKGGQTGEFQFTSSAGVVSSFIYPQGEAGSADVIPCTFTIRNPKVTKSTA